MIYTHEFTIPANTEETSQTIEEMKIVKGLIYKVEFLFPPGCAGLAHFSLYDETTQLWPEIEGTYFTSDDETISFNDIKEKNTDPSILFAHGWNEDTVFDHTIYIRIGIIDKEIYMAQYLPILAYELIQRQKEVEQQEKKEEKKQIDLILPFRKKKE